MEFKDIVRDLRIEHGMTQQQLADELHFSMSIINKWENGKKNPSVEAIKILAVWKIKCTSGIFTWLRKLKTRR